VLHRGQNSPLIAGVGNRLDRISSLWSSAEKRPALIASLGYGRRLSLDIYIENSQICEVAHTQIACTGIILRRVGNRAFRDASALREERLWPKIQTDIASP
jgi:hypothetical protein